MIAQSRPKLPRKATPPQLPNGKTPGGPKGLPPGLGGAARGGGPSGEPGTVAGLRKRLKTKAAAGS